MLANGWRWSNPKPDVIKCHPMSGLKPKIGAKQEAAVLALLSSKNVEEAARAAGVTPRTLYRWMSESDFDAAYPLRDAKHMGSRSLGFSKGLPRLPRRYLR